MELKDFKDLVNHRLVTDVTYVDHYINNEEAMAELKMEDLASIGMLSQPSTSVKLVEEGVSVLPVYGEKPMSVEKFIEMIAAGGYVKLTNDIDLINTCAIIEKDVTIDLNGHKIIGGVFAESNGSINDGNSDSFVFWVKSGILTINGDGVIESKDAKYSIAVWANGGDININGGTYINNGDGCDLIYLSNSANVNINGGEFRATEKISAEGTSNRYSAINIKDSNKSTCSVSVQGGVFYGFNPADNLSENPKMNFVADGYESVEISEDVWMVREVEIEVAEE